METTLHSGGLIGFVRSMFSSSKNAAHAGLGFFSKPEAWAVRLAALAGFVAIYVKSGAPTFGFEPVVFALAIGLSGLMFEACSAKNVIRSLWEGRMAGVAVWSCLWVCAFGYSAFNWISVAAENESGKTNMHKAAAYKTADVQSAAQLAGARVLELRKKAENLRVAAWESIPVIGGVQITDVAQADALIAKAKGNAKFWNLSDGCTAAKGPQARKFCAEYQDAVAARASAEKRSVIAEEFKSAEDELRQAEAAHEAARKTADATPVEMSTDRADLRILANFMGFEGDGTEQKVEQVAAVFKILAVSVFLSLGAAMVELERLRASGPRREFAFFGRAYRWFYRVLTGNEAPQPVYNVKIEGDGLGGEAIDQLKAFKRRVADVANQYPAPKLA